MTIGEKAEVAHTVEAVRKHMKEEAPYKLVGMKAHDLLTVATVATIIFPSEGDMVAIGMNDAAVCDGNTMGVPAKVGEHLIWSAEWRLRINNPFDAASAHEMAGECVLIVEVSEFVKEVQFIPGEGFSKRCHKKPAKQAR
ncbi:hypothetical protein BC360_30065 [Ensifer sp. LC163]|nr:hypothetical protein BC360_30065 [Ensifer sp. LC163]